MGYGENLDKPEFEQTKETFTKLVQNDWTGLLEEEIEQMLEARYGKCETYDDDLHAGWISLFVGILC